MYPFMDGHHMFPIYGTLIIVIIYQSYLIWRKNNNAFIFLRNVVFISYWFFFKLIGSVHLCYALRTCSTKSSYSTFKSSLVSRSFIISSRLLVCNISIDTYVSFSPITLFSFRHVYTSNPCSFTTRSMLFSWHIFFGLQVTQRWIYNRLNY
jgi:hypothetical protein